VSWLRERFCLLAHYHFAELLEKWTEKARGLFEVAESGRVSQRPSIFLKERVSAF
jgi:hypothetical protein